MLFGLLRCGCCSTFPSFPDARKLHIEGAKWKVNCLSISIMHVEKGGRRAKSFDLLEIGEDLETLICHCIIRNTYMGCILQSCYCMYRVYESVWFSNCVLYIYIVLQCTYFGAPNREIISLYFSGTTFSHSRNLLVTGTCLPCYR